VANHKERLLLPNIFCKLGIANLFLERSVLNNITLYSLQNFVLPQGVELLHIIAILRVSLIIKIGGGKYE